MIIEKKIQAGLDVEIEEYCILDVETTHEKPILSMIYLDNSLVTCGKDMMVMVYNLDLKFNKVKSMEEKLIEEEAKRQEKKAKKEEKKK